MPRKMVESKRKIQSFCLCVSYAKKQMTNLVNFILQNIAITPDGMVIIGLSEDNKITLWATMTDNCVPNRRFVKMK